MNAPQYGLMALGTLFVAVNVQVNGVEVIFPSFLGHLFIAIAAWNLRESGRVFGKLVIPAGLLALLTVPDMFRDAMPFRPDGTHPLYLFDVVTFYPCILMHIAVFSALCVGIAEEAARWSEPGLRAFALGTAVAVVILEIPRFFLPFETREALIAFFVVTSLYFGLIIAALIWAARTLR